MQTIKKVRRFETMSYLPPLTDAQISRQVEYILAQGYIPGVEFNEQSDPTEFYWTLWKLPLFQAESAQDVLREVQECRNEFPNCFVRVMGFDNVKQCQVVSFIVHKPRGY